MLLVDEAHATGVFGENGRGAAEHLGIEDCVTARVGTLSKALGCSGGFISGSRQLIDYVINRGRSYIYSTAPPAAIVAAALAALEIVIAEPQRRRELLARAASLRQQLAERGWSGKRGQSPFVRSTLRAVPANGDSPLFPTSASQIIPIVAGSPQQAVELSGQLRRRGLFVPAIRPPTVPEGESCLRVSLTWGHSPEHIAALVEALGPADS
jgi:8-amino-7-oxononanoate synthase